ncbi:hypothetical protein J3R82DRAFT_4213 [Butyriboletus roseoflavus]|nr:hypothetical protein J3R82DRAFT_4213 [Butyriboletus roseoflavus]
MSKPVVLVTGASKGIGLAVVKSLLEEHHACVVALARSRTPELTQLVDAHPASLLAISCDVTDESAQARAFSQAKDKFGPVLDGLILNAGTLDPLTRIGDPTVPLDAWKRHFDVNFFSLVSALKVALPALRTSPNTGRVVFVSSGAATGNIPGWAPYNAGKAAMNSLARTLAKEEPTLVSLAIAPGKVDTAMQQALRTTAAPHMDTSDLNIFLDAHRDGTLVQPSDVGYVIANLSLRAPFSLSGSFVRSTSPASRFRIIDVHHHVFLDAQQKAKKNTLVGWISPPEHLPWQPSPTMSAMDSMDIQTAILSPPPVATANRTEVRAMNIYLSQLRRAYSTRFGFFAGLPTLGDVQGSDTLGESQ